MLSILWGRRRKEICLLGGDGGRSGVGKMVDFFPFLQKVVAILASRFRTCCDTWRYLLIEQSFFKLCKAKHHQATKTPQEKIEIYDHHSTVVLISNEFVRAHQIFDTFRNYVLALPGLLPMRHLPPIFTHGISTSPLSPPSRLSS